MERRNIFQTDYPLITLLLTKLLHSNIMKKILTLIILIVFGVFGTLAQTSASVRNFRFGDNRIISKRNLCFIKGSEPVRKDDWRILNAKGYIGGNDQFVMIAYDEPNITQIVSLTGKISYDENRDCKFFGYKYGDVTGNASLYIDNDYYVFQFVAEKFADGTEKIYMYYFE